MPFGIARAVMEDIDMGRTVEREAPGSLAWLLPPAAVAAAIRRRRALYERRPPLRLP